MHFWDQHKTITRYYEILMSSVCEKYQLKHLEYDILMFLHNNPRGLTPEDIAVCKRVFQQVCSNAEACIKQKG